MISDNDSKGGLSGRKFAYVRVSTKDQCVDRQVDAMKREGLTDDQIVIEHQSGKDFERPLYKAQVKELKAGDTLYIKSIDICWYHGYLDGSSRCAGFLQFHA